MNTPRRPLSIAHITGEMGFSGGEVQVFLLADGLAKRGHRNIILCPPDSRSAREAVRRGLSTLPIRIRSEWSPRSAWRVRGQLIAAQPDLVFLHTGRANWFGGLAAGQLGLPAITVRRMDRAVRRDLRTRWVYRSVARRAVAISAAVEKRLIDGGVDPAMVRVIHSAVDPGALVPQRERQLTRRAEGVDSETRCLLALAALVHRKGLDVLVDALAILRDHGSRPLLWIAGEGPERASLEAQIEDLGLASQISLLGHRRDAADLIAASDIVVLPSRREGLGVAALEALAIGRAVIASAVGGLPESLVDGESAVLVPPDDPAALAGAISRLLDDVVLREKLARAGPARIASHFSVTRMVDAYERLCFEVVGESRVH